MVGGGLVGWAERPGPGQRQSVAHIQVDYAGRLSRKLLNFSQNYQTDKRAGQGNTFSLEEVEKSIKIGRQNLTSIELIKYRKDNLKEAISTWETVLAFAPENKEVKNALPRVMIQLGKNKKTD